MENFPKSIQQLDDHTQNEIQQILEILNNLHLTFDSRLVAALLASRAGGLYGKMISGEIISQEDALKIWEVAAEPIHNPQQHNTKIVYKSGDEVITPDKVN